jgi:outer membrane receptor protein involved in Fe transport
MSPRSYNDTSGVNKLPTIFDANIGAEYALKPNFRFFATVSNLTATNYQRWYNYPVYGLNFMGGFKWLF